MVFDLITYEFNKFGYSLCIVDTKGSHDDLTDEYAAITVELKNVFQSDSVVQLRVKDIHIESNYDPQNTITVELISEIDQEVTVNLNCQQSDDNIAGSDSETVVLKSGVPTAVELTFGGWPSFNYWVYIQAGNTKAEIAVNP